MQGGVSGLANPALAGHSSALNDGLQEEKEH